MEQLHWKEVIPGDQYIVSIAGPQNFGDDQVLVYLYQPLIGPVCVSLYMTLRNQVITNRLSSDAVSHYFLMNMLNVNLQEIFIARQKLEAIGLLNSFVKQEQDHRLFLYELNAPLSPQQFFSDGLLNIYLYQKIGREYYQRLKKFFGEKDIPKDDFKNITKEFQHVFTSSSSYPFQQNEEMDEETLRLSSKGGSAEISVVPDDFDFDLLLAGLNESLVPKKAITPQVKDVILKLAFLYKIDSIQMKNIVLGAVNEQDKIDIEELRKGARDWYTIENYSSLPKLVDRVQPPVYHSNIDVPKTKEDRLIRYLETVSPRQLLFDLSEGAEPSAADLKLVEDIMLNQKLSPGVVNVLLQYCLLRTDMKLSKSFAEKIASHWARKKVKSVQEAMQLAKDEHRKYLDWQQSKKEKKTVQKKPIRTEKVPDWFERRETPKEEETVITDLEIEKKELEEWIKKYGK